MLKPEDGLVTLCEQCADCPRRTLLFDRILSMMVIMAFFTASAMVVKKAYVQSILLIVIVPIWIIKFRSFCNQR